MATQLPRLPEVERVSSSVIRILGGNPSKFTLQGTNTYLLGKAGTKSRILVDTAQGFPVWSEALSSVLKDEQAVVATCLITHWHHDHIGGINDLRKICPEVQVWKHTPTLWDGEQSGQKPKDLDTDSVRRIEDGMVFTGEDGLKIRALHCPGHTDDHCAFIIDESSDRDERGSMLTGDNVLGHGTSVFSSLSKYMASLSLMSKSLPSDRTVKAYPAHGAVIQDGKAKIEEYIRHRQQREDEILEAMKAGSSASQQAGKPNGMTAMAIVKVVYKDVPENLHQPAEKGVLQVLEKLKQEGRVNRTEEMHWILSDVARDSNSRSAL